MVHAMIHQTKVIHVHTRTPVVLMLLNKHHVQVAVHCIIIYSLDMAVVTNC